MKRFLPFQSSSRPDPGPGSRIVEINGRAAGKVFEALASETTREVLTTLYETPGTASETADAVDTSLQNVDYHLRKLQDADLIEVADTWYSEQGHEMNVYAPTNESVVMLAGDDTTRTSIRETLSRLIGALGLLGMAGVLINLAARGSSSPTWHTDQSPAPWLSWVELLLSPGSVFFVGGMVALSLVVLWSVLSRR